MRTGHGCFIGGLLLLKNGFQALGWTLAIGFGVSVIGTLGYLFHRIYHVPCPRCGQETRTLKDLPKGRMVAICDRCRVTWDLGLRLGIGQ